MLLAALGTEPSDEAALRKHVVQDRGTTITSGVGEPQTGADFGDEGRLGEEKCRRNRSEKRQFRALGFSGDIKLTFPWSVKAPSTENLTGPCIQRRSGVCYRPVEN